MLISPAAGAFPTIDLEYPTSPHSSQLQQRSNPDRHIESAVAAYDLTCFHLRGSSGMKPLSKTAERRWQGADIYRNANQAAHLHSRYLL